MFKSLKLKMRNPIFMYEKFYDNDSYFIININLYDFGLGFNYRLGDSRRFLNIDLLLLHLEVWF